MADVLIDLLVSRNSDMQRDAATYLAALADSDENRSTIIEEYGLQRILQLYGVGSDAKMIEQTVIAVHVVSETHIAAKALSSMLMFCIQVSGLINCGNAGTQLAAASIVSNLTPAEETRKAMSGCTGLLIEMLKVSKMALAQEAAAGALVELLSVKSNKELARDEKYATRLARMLDTKREEVYKVFAVVVVLAVSAGGGGGRKWFAEAGACQHLQKLADAEVPGTKKALVRITGGWITLFSTGCN